MKYISIDIETLGLDAETCDIIEFGAIVDDLRDPKPLNELPRFHTYVLPYDGVYSGEPYAMWMNHKILDKIAHFKPNKETPPSYVSQFLRPDEVAHRFRLFVDEFYKETKIIPAGKNFSGFDVRFLERLPNWKDYVKCGHRVIDPAMLYWNPLEDKEVPDTKTCMVRAGLSGEVQHTSLDDAEVVIRLIRNKAFCRD